MRFAFAESMVDPSMYAPMARAAEAAGFDTFVVPDSIAYPKESDSTYPFTADGSREFLEDKPFIEPFALIPALAAVTERIKFVTFVLKLPIRPPLLVAKQVASVAVLSGNRLELGVGVSPWPEDFELMGVPFAGRGKRMDESIDILRGLTAGGFFEYHGTAYDLPAIKIAPVPDRPVPILIGGHSDAALARAARNDGWMHGGGDPADLPGLIEQLAAKRAELGRDDRDFRIYVISADAYTPDGIARLEAMGITDVIVGFRWPYVPGPDTQPLQEKLDNIARFGDAVIAKVRAREG